MCGFKRQALLSLFALLTTFLFACGGGGGSSTTSGTGPSGISLSGLVSATSVSSKPRSRAVSPTFAGGKVYAINSSGSVVGTTDLNADGSFTVAVPPGKDYFLRAVFGNVALTAFLPDATSDATGLSISPYTTVVVKLLGDELGNHDVGGTGTAADVSTTITGVVTSAFLHSIATDTAVSNAASGLAHDISTGFGTDTRTSVLGQADASQDSAISSIASSISTGTGTATSTNTGSNTATNTNTGTGTNTYVGMTGRINYSAHSLAETRKGVEISGIGTAFTSQLQIGDEITDANLVIWKVISIDSDVSLLATSTELASVPNQTLPGAQAYISLREGYYYVNPSVGAQQLRCTQRVPSNYVNDVSVGDVLAIGGGAYPVTSITNYLSSPGLGRGFVASLGQNTLLDGSAVIENPGFGYVKPTGSGVADPIDVYGSWGNGGVAAQDGLYSPPAGDFVNDGIKTPGSALSAGGITLAGKGYSSGALSLAAAHPSSASSGAEVTIGGAAVAIDATAAVSSFGLGYHVGDLLAVRGGGTNPTLVGLLQVGEVNGAGAIATATVGIASGPGNSTIVVYAGSGYASGGIYATTNLGTFLNATTTGALGTAAQGMVVQTAVGTVAGNDASLGPAGSAVTSDCSNTSVSCFLNVGSAGAIAGDVINVHNPNGSVVAGATNGSMRIVSVDPGTGAVFQARVVNPGAKYPNAGAVSVTTYGGVMTSFQAINLSTPITNLPATITAGSNLTRGATTDLAKY